MKNDIHFWAATLIRGILALVVGSAAMVIPDMAKTLLLLPFAIVISILCLGCYGVIDSAIVFVSSFMVATSRARIALRLQGAMGAMVGVLLLSVAYDMVRLHWFLYLVGFQALCAAIAEFVVARHASTKKASIWSYSASAVAFVCSLAYTVAAIAFGENLTPEKIAWLVYGYLVAFGMAQCLTAARMLYVDREASSLIEIRAF